MEDGLADGDAQAHEVRVDGDEGEDGGEVPLIAWGGISVGKCELNVHEGEDGGEVLLVAWGG